MALSRDMSPQQAIEVMQTLLDEPENRFPLTFNSDLPRIRELFRTKSLDDLLAETQEEGHQLKKALGPWNLVALGIGAIIGAGIFATIGTAAAGDSARPGAGPALVLSFVLKDRTRASCRSGRGQGRRRRRGAGRGGADFVERE